MLDEHADPGEEEPARECPVLRVLCVEDEADPAQRLKVALESLGRPLDFEWARTYEDARELLVSQHFCIAFVDLVLDPEHDTNTEDWDGLRLIEDIADVGLLGHLPVVIVTHYQNPEVIRKAFAGGHIKDFIWKSSLPEDLQMQVRGVVDQDRACRLDCEVELLDGLQWSTLLERISRGRLTALTSLVTPAMALVELDHLVRRLFAEDSAIQVSELSGGRTATAVIRVARRLEGGRVVRPAVVKIGEARWIEQERYGFQSLSNYLGGRSTRLEDHCRGVHLGALRYTLIGGEGNEVLSFGQYYLEADTTKVQQMLRGLFKDTCGLFYDPRNRMPVAQCDVVGLYRERLGLDVAKLERGYQFKFGNELADRPTIFHHDFVEVPNAVLALKQGRIELVTDSFLCPTHGDMHGDNVVISPEDGGGWLIDFGSAGMGHWARDFAVLECYVRYRLLQTSDLGHLYAFEQALLATGSLGGEPDLGGLFDGELRRAGRIIGTIRQHAHEASLHHPTAFVEYQVAVLMTSLLYMQFHVLLNRKWRKWQVMMTAGCLLESTRSATS